MSESTRLTGERTTALGLREMMDAGEISSSELIWHFLDRVARYDSGTGGVNAILELNPDAPHIAEARDRELAENGPRGPLHGLPVLLKDNIDTGDRMHTSAGTLALAQSRARRDAFFVQKLREAGAVIMGKTNMTEMANFMTRGMPNGYSSRGGQVLNPYGPAEFDVGGSSSGSAAAVAAEFSPLAVGTETSGSILSPASRNSLVGIKPTVGLISRRGVIPISHSQDTAGPMATTVADAALMLGAMAGVDVEDPVTETARGNAVSDYTTFLKADGLRGARLGVPEGYLEDLDESRMALVERALDAMREAGATIVDLADLPTGELEWPPTVLLYEFKPALNVYLDGLDPRVPVHSLRELIRFNLEHSRATLRYGQILLQKSEATSGTLTEPKYIMGRRRDLLNSRQNGIDQVMAEWDLDALVFADNLGSGPAARAGYPSITVPGGYDESGSPLGITFTARAFAEPRLIELAHSFERVTRFRVPPAPDGETPRRPPRAAG
ncbi:MAG: amidase family protein [Bacillota bacterium]